MSETMNLSSRDIKIWLERETGSIFVPVHAKAQKMLDEMGKHLGALTEVSRMLLDSSGKEIEKRNMKTYRRARALNKLARLFVDRLHQVKVPNKVSYDSFSAFVQEMQKAFLVTEVDVRNWFPRISPFFILDRRKFLAVFERAKESLKGLQNFLTRDYVKTKTLEDTFQLIDRILALEQQASSLKEQMKKTEAETFQVQKEIGETQQRMTDLRSKGSISQLDQTGTEIDSLRIEIKHSLQHLQKPFIKLQSLATHGEGSGLTPEELGKLDQYLENPFNAFSTEAEGLPILRQILQKLNRSLSEGKLKLKPEKIRKAEQAIDSIVNKNSLESLHRKCRDAMMRKTQLSTSTEVAMTQQDLSRLRQRLEDLARKKGIFETEEAFIQRRHKEAVEKISTHKHEIEKNIFDFMDKKVHIE